MLMLATNHSNIVCPSSFFRCPYLFEWAAPTTIDAIIVVLVAAGLAAASGQLVPVAHHQSVSYRCRQTLKADTTNPLDTHTHTHVLYTFLRSSPILSCSPHCLYNNLRIFYIFCMYFPIICLNILIVNTPTHTLSSLLGFLLSFCYI